MKDLIKITSADGKLMRRVGAVLLACALVSVSWGPGVWAAAGEADSGAPHEGFPAESGSAFGPGAIPGNDPSLPELERPYDFKAEPLHEDEQVEFLVEGYRLDQQMGHILSPETQKPISTAQAFRMQAGFKQVRLLKALQMLWHLSTLSSQEADAGNVELALSKIFKRHQDVLPKEIRLARIAGRKAFQPSLSGLRHEALKEALLPHLTRLEVGQMAQPPPGGASKSPGYFDENEAKLGALFQSELIRHFEKTPQGVHLLEELKKDGRIDLPKVVVADFRASAGGGYDGPRNVLVLNRLAAARSILSRAAPSLEPTVARDIKGQSGMTGYLLAHPQAVRAFIEDHGETFFHELIHHSQYLNTALDRAQVLGILPRHEPVEREYEAFFRAALHLHAKMIADPAAPQGSDLERYWDLVKGFDGWLSGIDRDYGAPWSAEAVKLSGLEALQREKSERARLYFKQGLIDRERFKARRLDAMLGFAILRIEQDQVSRMIENFRRMHPEIRLAAWLRQMEMKGSVGRGAAGFDLLKLFFDGLPSRQKDDPMIRLACRAAMAFLFRPVRPALTMEEMELDLSQRVSLVEAMIKEFGGVPEIEFGRQFWKAHETPADHAGLIQLGWLSLAKERRQPESTLRMAHSLLAELYADVLADQPLLDRIRNTRSDF